MVDAVGISIAMADSMHKAADLFPEPMNYMVWTGEILGLAYMNYALFTKLPSALEKSPRVKDSQLDNL